MMHFFYGMFFLFCTIALVVVYVLVGYLLMVGIQRIVHARKNRAALAKGKELPKLKTWPFYSGKTYLKIIILSSIILIGIYVQQRIEWMGKENAHYTAKEYWVSGQALSSVRIAATYILHPENILLKPFNRLQSIIYNKGIQYLPKDDGEIGVWTDVWFLYPYSRTIILPKVTTDPQYRWKRNLIDPVFKSEKMFPEIISILDRSWGAIETISTKPFADKKMRFNGYLNIPRLATYYHVYDGFYMGKALDAYKTLLKDKLHIDRREKLLQWLDELKDRWEADGIYSTIWEKYPKVEAGRQVLRLEVLQDDWEILANRNEFDCGNPLIKKLHQTYVDLMGGDTSSNILLHLSTTNMHDASFLYTEALYRPIGEETQYLLTAVCHYELPEEKLILISKKDADFKKWMIHGIKRDVERKLNLFQEGK